MSNLVMVSIACVTAAALAGSRIISKNRVGTTCHERPYWSVSQPHTFGAPPPASSASQ